MFLYVYYYNGSDYFVCGNVISGRLLIHWVPAKSRLERFGTFQTRSNWFPNFQIAFQTGIFGIFGMGAAHPFQINFQI